jgi:co-chaperonin GroES (HSP10)
MNTLEPNKGRAVVKVLEEAKEEKSSGGIIMPNTKKVTKEITQGQIVAINDPENITGGYTEGDIIVFRSVACLPCGNELAIMNVSHIEGRIVSKTTE